MTKESKLKLSSAYVLTMNMPPKLRDGLLLHVERIVAMTSDEQNQHRMLRMTCPLFYEDFISHIQSLNN